MPLHTVRGWPTGDPSSSSPERKLFKADIDFASTALIIIDPWTSHHNAVYQECIENIGGRIASFSSFLKDEGGAVVLHSVGKPVVPALGPEKLDYSLVFNEEHSSRDYQQLNTVFESMGIRTVLFAGGAVNLCVMSRPIGFRALLHADWSRQYGLVRDLLCAFEPAEVPHQGASEGFLLNAAFYEAEYYYPYAFTVFAGDLSQGAAT